MALKYGEEMFGEPPFDEPYTIFEVKLPAEFKVEKRRVTHKNIFSMRKFHPDT